MYRPSRASFWGGRLRQLAHPGGGYGLASHTNIQKPLTRALSIGSEQGRGLKGKWPLYYYQFPRIPRPKRNVLYYSTWSGKASTQLKRFLTKILTLSRHKRRAYFRLSNPAKNWRLWTNRRFFSLRAGGSGEDGGSAPRLRRAYIKWWTLLLLSVILGGAGAMALRRRGAAEPEGSSEPSEAIGPQLWKLYAYLTLPLKAISRLWGQFNQITVPVWLRSPLYHFYLYVFGVNLEEMADPDLRNYANLGEFFYRTLKDGVRPIDEADVVSPADGKVLKFGAISNGKIEQVKGMTYLVDALLGTNELAQSKLGAPQHLVEYNPDAEVMERHRDFAELNGMAYTLDDLIGDGNKNLAEGVHHHRFQYRDKGDKTATGGAAGSRQEQKKHEVQLAMDLQGAPAGGVGARPVPGPSAAQVAREAAGGERAARGVHEAAVPEEADYEQSEKSLFFAVIYLAPGDYHRFHSPVNWVTTLRRHFVGELFSVAPYFQKTLNGLFVLNERVALLGYWRHGFFSMTPVGATNVGSIVVNFDKDLRTNDVYEHEVYLRLTLSLSGDTAAGSSDDELVVLDSTAALADESTSLLGGLRRKRLAKNTVYEATYTKASKVLGGVPLVKGQEVGGFKLGLTVVLVFEAPKSFRFDLLLGQKIKVGERMGRV